MLSKCCVSVLDIAVAGSVAVGAASMTGGVAGAGVGAAAVADAETRAGAGAVADAETGAGALAVVLDVCSCWCAGIRSIPGTMAAGTGGGAGSGDVGSRVGSNGARTSGNFV